MELRGPSVEGVLIAAGLRDSREVEVRLPAELTGHEAALLNAVDAVRSLAHVSTPRMQLEVQRDSHPGPWAEQPGADASRLIHTPETWCRIALLFAGASGLDASLLTLRRGIKQRGLVELAHSQSLRAQIDGWGGGVEVEGQDPVLVFDDGLGGFLPFSAADVSCRPLSLASAGVVPVASTLMVMAEGACLLRQTRRALYRHWQLADNPEGDPVRPLLARAGRLVAELTLGRGDATHLRALDEVALELGAQGLAAAWPLVSSLRYYREQWESHARRESCPEGLCFEHQAAPCHGTCPANIDIPSFIAHIGHGDYRAAIEVIRRDNPLPLTCGLVCPAPCESACVRGGSNGAVSIRPLKAKAAEHCLADGGYPKPQIAPDSGKRIGIVGSGPAGLTAAYYLRTFGHEVEILEEQEKAGGMLRYGIPGLPPAARPARPGARPDPGAGNHDPHQRRGRQPRRLPQELRRRVPRPRHPALAPDPDRRRPSVLRARRHRFPARRAQRRAGPRRAAGDRHRRRQRRDRRRPDGVAPRRNARRHGLAGEPPRDAGQPPRDRKRRRRRRAAAPGLGPVSIGEDGETTFQLCEQVHDETGKFDPKFDAARLLTLEGDQVILATGQGTDLTILDGSAVETTHGFILTDPKSLMTKVPGVYAGGDVEHGPRTVVEAIRSGKIAASAIDAWLRGTAMDNATGTPVRRADVAPLQVTADERTHLPRAVMPERTVEEVLGLGNYVQIEEGLTDAMAHDEARRCLRCDVCIGCGLCMAACSEMGVDALRMADTDAGRLAYFDFTRPAELCIGCGACSQVCPTGAIRIDDQVGLFAGGTLGGGTPDLVRRTIITGTVVCEQPLLTCSECGAPTQTPAHREFIRNRLPDHMAALLDRELCPSCARLRADRPAESAAGRGAVPGSPTTERSTLGDSGDAPPDTEQRYSRRNHEGRHGSAGGCWVRSLRGGPRTGREHRIDPGRGGRRGHLRNGRGDHLRRVRLGAPRAGAADPRARVAGTGPRPGPQRGQPAEG